MAAIPPVDADSAAGRRPSAAYPLALLIVYAAWWLALAIAPRDREAWLLENALVFATLPLLIRGYRGLRYSNLAYTAMFLFFCVHAVGAHYTYSEVPYDVWLERWAGFDLQTVFGFERNHFDRGVHFLYGMLLMPAIAELLQARGRLQGMWRQLLPLMFLMANSELYELIEWQAAAWFGGSLGQAFLGTQGDVWDAQKDSTSALLGGLLGLPAYRLLSRVRPRWGPNRASLASPTIHDRSS
jgi:putative membrane protein